MSDLIDESGEDLSAFGYETVNLGKFGVTASKLFVNQNRRIKDFEKGHYFIINAPNLSLLMEEHREILQTELTYRLKFLFKEQKITKSGRILFVGIGNPAVMADSFGVRTVEKITIMPFKKKNRVFKIMPNVFANTGLNACDIIRLVVEAFDISAVFLFDSLATKTLSRLGTSIQFNDAGLTPGSAMNNFGMPINKSTLNVPCFALGVPMMISSASLGEKKEIVLAEKDVEEKIEFLSGLVAEVIDTLI